MLDDPASVQKFSLKTYSCLQSNILARISYVAAEHISSASSSDRTRPASRVELGHGFYAVTMLIPVQWMAGLCMYICREPYTEG